MAVDDLDVTPLDLSPTSHVAYLWEKAQCLNAQQADLEVERAKLEKRKEIEHHQANGMPALEHAVQHKVDNRAGTPGLLRIPRVEYTTWQAQPATFETSLTRRTPKTNEKI